MITKTSSMNLFISTSLDSNSDSSPKAEGIIGGVEADKNTPHKVVLTAEVT